MSKPEKACGAVIIHDHRALLIFQNNGFWGFPKGHVEPSESETETALREVKEETGLDITLDPSTRHSFSYYIESLDIDKEVVLFLAHLANPAQATSRQVEEIAELRWIPIDEVESLLTFPEWKEAWRHFLPNIK